MTTILYDVQNALLAADSMMLCNGNSCMLVSTIKGRVLPDGSLVGWSGPNEDGQEWEEWMALRCEHPDTPRPSFFEEGFGGLHLTTTGRLYKYETRHIACPILEPFYAIGNGSDWAMAAMACGKDIVEAMRLACRYSPFTQPPIRVYSLKDPTHIVCYEA